MRVHLVVLEERVKSVEIRATKSVYYYYRVCKRARSSFENALFSEMSLRAHITMKFEVLSDNLLKKMGVKKYYDEFCIRTTS